MKGMRLFAQRITAMALCFSVMTGMIPFYGIKSFAAAPDASTLGETGGYLQGALQTIEKTYEERKFNYVQGHGFSAERANNLSDVLRGEKAVVVGDNNVKNGPDRQILNRDGTTTYIQDKYCATASESLNAAFDSATGEYRYSMPDGTAMCLEVPADQYDDVLRGMEQKIRDGKVPGVSDPAEAVNYVRKGKYTYEQATNLVKAGNIDSLRYDATNGAIVAASALGISFALDFVSCTMNGESFEDATKKCSIEWAENRRICFCDLCNFQSTGKIRAESWTGDWNRGDCKSPGKGCFHSHPNTFGESAAGLTSSQIAARMASIFAESDHYVGRCCGCAFGERRCGSVPGTDLSTAASEESCGYGSLGSRNNRGRCGRRCRGNSHSSRSGNDAWDFCRRNGRRSSFGICKRCASQQDLCG